MSASAHSRASIRPSVRLDTKNLDQLNDDYGVAAENGMNFQVLMNADDAMSGNSACSNVSKRVNKMGAFRDENGPKMEVKEGPVAADLTGKVVIASNASHNVVIPKDHQVARMSANYQMVANPVAKEHGEMIVFQVQPGSKGENGEIILHDTSLIPRENLEVPDLKDLTSAEK